MNKSGSRAVEALQEKKKKSGSAKAENSPEINETLEKLLKGEDIYDTLSTSRGNFKMIYPRPRVLRQIQVMLVERYHGQNLNNIPDKTLRNSEVYATLDAVITEAPDWWDSLDSSEDCPDDDLILQLYRGYLRFYGKVQQKIKRPERKPGVDSKKQPLRNEKEIVGNGSFSGITHGSEDIGTI